MSFRPEVTGSNRSNFESSDGIAKREAAFAKLLGFDTTVFAGQGLGEQFSQLSLRDREKLYAVLKTLQTQNEALKDKLDALSGRKTVLDLEQQLHSVSELSRLDANGSGALNRVALAERFDELVESGEVKDKGLLYFDLNKLKIMNDRYNHLVGDLFIRTFVKGIVYKIRQDDLTNLYRIGGDEFVMIVDSNDPEVVDATGLSIAKRIHKFLKENLVSEARERFDNADEEWKRENIDEFQAFLLDFDDNLNEAIPAYGYSVYGHVMSEEEKQELQKIQNYFSTTATEKPYQGVVDTIFKVTPHSNEHDIQTQDNVVFNSDLQKMLNEAERRMYDDKILIKNVKDYGGRAQAVRKLELLKGKPRSQDNLPLLDEDILHGDVLEDGAIIIRD